MKRNENRKNRNWRNFVVLTLVCMLAATLVGCKTSTAVTPEPSTSEVVSEPVSEPVSEEVSEIVSEEPSEEVVSEEFVEEVEIVKYSNADELLEYVDSLNKTTIVEYNFGEEGSSQAIIPNGEKYTMQMGNILRVIPNKEAIQIEPNVEYIDIMEPARPNVWGIVINSTGSDVEVSCTIKYSDGTEEDIIVYVTNE